MVSTGTSGFAETRDLGDVLVVGSGPAGLTLAQKLAERGRETTLIAPEVGTLWSNSYGTFLKDVAGTGVESAIRRVFERPQVHMDGDRSITIREAYARFDTTLLQTQLMERAARAGVKFLNGDVRRVFHDGTEGRTTVEACIDPGPGDQHVDARVSLLRTKLVVDASGGRLNVEGEARRRPTLHQSAFGYFAEVESHPFGPGEMSLMDYRSPSADPSGPATFLYAMPETGSENGPGTLFVQETSLVRPQPVSMNDLRERLTQRLMKMGITLGRVLGTERCVIPMGGSLPEPTSLVLPFGAAAGLVHPATGYQLAHMLRLAPGVVDAVESAWPDGPHEAIRAGIETMWPDRRRQSWRLFELGAHALASLSPDQMSSFTFEFFSLSGGRGVRFMAGAMDPHEILETMWRVFSRAPRRLRTDLFRGSATATSRLVAQRLL